MLSLLVSYLLVPEPARDFTIRAGASVFSLAPVQDYTKPYQALKPNVVHITIMDDMGKEVVRATGWLKEDGATVVTAKHVIEMPAEYLGRPLTVKDLQLSFLDGSKPAALSFAVGKDDVAAIKLKSKKSGGLKMATKNEPVGMGAYFLGWSGWDEDPTFAQGHVSGYSYSEKGSWWRMFLQSTALPGNSGSPVVNKDCRVIGLVVQLRNDNFSYVYAVPWDTLNTELPTLMKELK